MPYEQGCSPDHSHGSFNAHVITCGFAEQGRGWGWVLGLGVGEHGFDNLQLLGSSDTKQGSHLNIEFEGRGFHVNGECVSEIFFVDFLNPKP